MLYVVIIIGLVAGVICASWVWSESRGVDTNFLKSPIHAATELFSNPSMFGFLRSALVLILCYIIVDFLLSCVRKGIDRIQDQDKETEEEVAWWEIKPH